LYRRVNKFLRVGTESDRETGRNLGLYITLLRECFGIRKALSPVSWDRPKIVYRGANFRLDEIVEYARHPDEEFRWQGFTSSSRDRGVALDFPGNVLFQISLRHSVASLDEVSAFKHERECVLNPEGWFSVKSVRWDVDCGRWILSVSETGTPRRQAGSAFASLLGLPVPGEPGVRYLRVTQPAKATKR
jgi:hypothetical protein